MRRLFNQSGSYRPGYRTPPHRAPSPVRLMNSAGELLSGDTSSSFRFDLMSFLLRKNSILSTQVIGGLLALGILCMFSLNIGLLVCERSLYLPSPQNHSKVSLYPKQSQQRLYSQDSICRVNIHVNVRVNIDMNLNVQRERSGGARCSSRAASTGASTSSSVCPGRAARANAL